MGEELQRSAAAVRRALDGAGRGLVDRAALVELVALGAVAREHLLVLGPPGTAKSLAVRQVARAFGGRYFEYLLGRFTEPSELFGPIDLARLREGVVETETAGMLPEADIAFLDEVFLGSTAILNTLLALLNERRFRRGHTDVAVPLRVCVGAANELPDEISLAAFADRFTLRLFVDPVADAQLEELLEHGWLAETGEPESGATTGDLDRLAAAARAADLAPIRADIASAVRELRGAGVTLTDRRIVKVQRLCAAAAVLAGRAVPTAADLWPIVYAVPTREGQGQARDVLRDVLAASQSDALAAAAEEASAGPAARAARLVRTAEEILAREPGADENGRAQRRLQLEGVLREIDAGFAPEALPPELGDVRRRVARAVSADDGIVADR